MVGTASEQFIAIFAAFLQERQVNHLAIRYKEYFQVYFHARK